MTVELGTSEKMEFNARASKYGYWRTNISQPNFAYIRLPDGQVWDLYCFSSNIDNPLRIDQDVKLEVTYTGLVLMGQTKGSKFQIIIRLLNQE